MMVHFSVHDDTFLRRHENFFGAKRLKEWRVYVSVGYKCRIG